MVSKSSSLVSLPLADGEQRVQSPAAARAPVRKNPGRLQLQPVETRVLREQVLASLRTAIVDRHLQPGDRILEADVASQMQVSRAPVREALRQLEQEGLIEFSPHRGATVVGVPNNEMDTIYDMRALIEAKAVRRVCQQATVEDLAVLETYVVAMQEASNFETAATADLGFHAAILEISGYRLLKRMWYSMDSLVRARSRQTYAARQQEERDRYHREALVPPHAAILDAVRARDPDAAERAVREHIVEVADRIRAEAQHTAMD